MRKARKKVEYGVYDVKDNYLLVDVSTVEEIAQRFETSIAVIRTDVCRQRLKQGRYKIERL